MRYTQTFVLSTVEVKEGHFELTFEDGQRFRVDRPEDLQIVVTWRAGHFVGLLEKGALRQIKHLRTGEIANATPID